MKVRAWGKGVDHCDRATVMDLGDVQARAQELRLSKGDGTGRLLIGQNVPAHRISPELREFTEGEVLAFPEELEAA
ncbi:hypothetical protein ABZT03_02320 [Streptomyces sp. NPDC005574]|uniref:hypothetical protein n=1 Tax=Streptomyces sp. NPDC005574 TaxID=3156891 RepID=UPI0033A937AB